MKKQIKLALVAALALGATSAFATNGDIMIGQGAKSRAMGGVGIAKSFGAESALVNPANISTVKDMEVTVAVTVFMPDVSFKSSFAGPNPEYQKSASDLSVIPEVFYAARLSDDLVLSVAIAGTAGMGVDYSDDKTGATAPMGTSGTARMKTNLQLLKVAVPVSYKVNDFTLGVAAIMQYGTLEMSHIYNTTGAQAGPYAFIDNGASSDTGFGYELGATYENSGFTVGAVYKSAIAMTYDNTISGSLAVFGQTANITSGDNLDQPAEYGVGLAYENTGNTISFDYKKIAWGSAAGYEDFGWSDQDVYALGYEYAAKGWALRAGYNYAKSPISEQNGADATRKGASQNFFNLSGFPGIVESHYSIGGGMAFGDFTIDGSVIYAPEVSESYSMSALASPGTSVDTQHSQTGITIAGTYAF